MSNSSSQTGLPAHPAYKGMRSIFLGIVINIVLAVVKAIAGYLGNSYALIADAIESTIDIFSSALVYLGLKYSTKPPDKNHPYGHGKVEPLVSALLAVFLFLAAVIITMQSIYRIQNPHPLPASWTLIVLLVVIAIKEILYRFVLQVADETSSNAVKGDAFHHRSDAITSLAAFLGIAVANIGNYFYPEIFWACADDWATLIVSVAIAYNGWTIMRQALYELTDARPDSRIEQDVRRVAMTVEGVKELDKCRIRKMGLEYYVELDVRVDRDMPVHQAHAISHHVQDKVRAEVMEGRIAKVFTHIEPTKS